MFEKLWTSREIAKQKQIQFVNDVLEVNRINIQDEKSARKFEMFFWIW